MIIKDTEFATDILHRIISKGGLMASAAKMYINDEEKTDQYIRECADQCHNKSAQVLWGEKLVKDIEEYKATSLSRWL